VLGATVTNIVVLLSGKFVKLVMVASIIALPLAYFVFDRWLENYAFRIEIGWWFFVIPILVVFLIAIVTISVQTMKAALANPVDSLKYE
jgi:putative ABC transport system permease protein